MTPAYRLEVSSIDSVIVRLFEHIDEANLPWLCAAALRLRSAFSGALIDLVPSYTTLLLQYDLMQLDAEQARGLIDQALHNLQPANIGAGRQLQLPTWYDPSVGPELPALALRSQLTTKALIARHCARTYSVFALGFTPGFAFMGLVEPLLAYPRLNTPRKRICAGSVGIAERQTAVYPSPSPGGWNIIGRTPVRLFDPMLEGFSLLQPGDQVRFVSITHQAFLDLGGDDTPLAAAP